MAQDSRSERPWDRDAPSLGLCEAGATFTLVRTGSEGTGCCVPPTKCRAGVDGNAARLLPSHRPYVP